MAGKLFYMAGDKVTELHKEEYEKEDYLQKRIADNPELMLRNPDQEDEELILVGREYSVAEIIGGSEKFYLDILFLNQEGVPVLVEVKRSSNTEIKREIVGQMIDYASRVASWDIETLKEAFRLAHAEGTAERERYDNEEFWAKVSANLQAERIKLVFAADEIPVTLREMICFLDRRMPDIEVYGVEIPQYRNSYGQTIVSANVIAEKREKQNGRKIRTGDGNWTLDNFKICLTKLGLENRIAPVEEMYCFATEKMNLYFEAGTGNTVATMNFKRAKDERSLFRFLAKGTENGKKACVLEFYTKELERLLQPGKEYKDGPALRDFLTDAVLARSQELDKAWCVQPRTDYLFIDPVLLADREAMVSMQAAIRKLCEVCTPDGKK